MYNSVIKIFSCIVIAFILCSCGNKSANVEFSVNDYETSDEKVFIQTPKVSGLTDKNFETTLNGFYNEFTSTTLNDFLSDSQKSRDGRDTKAELEIRQNVMYNNNDILSILGECYQYTDGYNGISTRIAKNLNTKTNSEILLKDIFNDNEYIKMLNLRLLEMSETAQYSDLWETPVIGKNQNQYFYFSDNGLVIFYPPYELSYYARGFVEFTIPYSQLYGYLKPEYSFLY